MIKVQLYENGKIKINKNPNIEDEEKWLHGSKVSSYFYCGDTAYEAILLNSDKSCPEFEKIIDSKVKNIDKEIKKLTKQKQALLDLEI